MGNKHQPRAQRLLAQMDRQACRIQTTHNSKTVLVLVEGLRTIKCDAELIAGLISSGAITLSGDKAEVTDAGRALTKREAAVNHPFRAQHDDIALKCISSTDAEGGNRVQAWKTDESPLARLSKLKANSGQAYLSTLELDAGERLRCDFEAGMMQPRVSASLDPSRVAGNRSSKRNHALDLTDAAIGARDRVAQALEKLEPELAGIAIDICCFLKGLETVESERGWPRRSAKLMLKTALGGLARHYFPTPKANRGSQTTLHWGAEEYRPSLR